MPLMNEFAGFLRQEMEIAVRRDSLDSVFDVQSPCAWRSRSGSGSSSASWSRWSASRRSSRRSTRSSRLRAQGVAGDGGGGGGGGGGHIVLYDGGAGDRGVEGCDAGVARHGAGVEAREPRVFASREDVRRVPGQVADASAARKHQPLSRARTIYYLYTYPLHDTYLNLTYAKRREEARSPRSGEVSRGVPTKSSEREAAGV